MDEDEGCSLLAPTKARLRCGCRSVVEAARGTERMVANGCTRGVCSFAHLLAVKVDRQAGSKHARRERVALSATRARQARVARDCVPGEQASGLHQRHAFVGHNVAATADLALKVNRLLQCGASSDSSAKSIAHFLSRVALEPRPASSTRPTRQTATAASGPPRHRTGAMVRCLGLFVQLRSAWCVSFSGLSLRFFRRTCAAARACSRATYGAERMRLLCAYALSCASRSRRAPHCR